MPTAVTVRSNGPPSRSAASMPSRMPTGTRRTRLAQARISERPSRSSTSGRTGTSKRSERPQSPVTSPPAQRR